MRKHSIFWRDTLCMTLRNIDAAEQMLRQKSIQQRWPQYSIVVDGIKTTRQRAGDIIGLLGGMDAAW